MLNALQISWRHTHRLKLVALLAAAMTLLLGGLLHADDKTVEKPANPRALFRMLGVGDEYFNRLIDGRPIEGDETESLLRIMFRLRMFPPLDVDRWAMSAEDLAKVVRQPNEFRGSIFLLRGRVLEVERLSPATEAAQRYELFKYFRCRLQLDSPERIVEIYTENVPEIWQQGVKPNVPGGARGVFLKLGKPSDGQPTLIFATGRLAWYPDDLLGNLGMDVGLLDDVKDRKPLLADEDAAFYQMLAAVGRAEPGELIQRAEAALPGIPRQWRRVNDDGHLRYSVVPLFNEPKAQRGRLVELFGTARRIEEIYVNDPDIVARFGIDHYYQVSLFTDDSYNLDPARIEPKQPEGTPCPLTFCVRELPKGMPYGNLPRYGETVRIAGFSFKSWSYDAPKVYDSSLKPGDQLPSTQFSPLLIGRGLIWYPATKEPTQSGWVTLGIGVLFVTFMLVVWGVAWQNRRQAKRWEHQIIGDGPMLDSGIDLGPSDGRDDDHPDFSHLANMD